MREAERGRRARSGRVLGLWGALAVALGAVSLAGCDGAEPASSSAGCENCPDLQTVREELLPPIETVWENVRKMAEMGVRLTGSPAHNRYIDFLEAELERIGCENIQRDTVPIHRWEPISWGLARVPSGETVPETIPVAGYYPYSGVTDAGGVVAPLVYRAADDLEGIAGRIVLIEGAIPHLTAGLFALMATYVHEPDRLALLRLLGEDYTRPWLSLAAITPNLAELKRRGALGLVLWVDLPAEEANGQYMPFTTEYQDLPAVLVDRETGGRLKQQLELEGSFPVRLTMEARRELVPTYHLMGFLPGRTDSMIVLNTHTDGQNAVEENGALGLLALGEYFAKVPRCCREHTVCLSFVSGHFHSEVQANRDWIPRHPEIVSRMRAAIILEHCGTTQWEETANGGYGPTGRVEPGALFVSGDPALLDLTIAAVKEQDLRRSVVIQGFSFGVGIGFLLNHLPMIGYLTGPTYLLNAENGGLDKLDKDRMAREIRTFAEILGRVDRLPPLPPVAPLGPAVDALPHP